MGRGKTIFKRFSLTLSHKGFILVCVPLLFELAFVVILTLLLQQAEREAEREAQSKSIITKTNILTKLFLDAGGSLAAYSVSKNPVFGEHYDQAVRKIPGELHELKDLVQTNPRQVENLRGIEKSIDRALDLLNRMKESTDEGSRISSLMSGHRIYKELKQLIEQLELDLNSFVEEERRIERQSPQKQAAARRNVHNFLLIGTGVNVVLALFMAHLFYTGITGRLRTLTDNTFRLARSEALNPPLSGSDEIAHLDRVFHDMASALVEAARKERAVIENALDVICSIDAEGGFTAVSPASLEVWGYSPEELIGRKYTDLVLAEDVENTLAAARDIMLEHSVVPFENRTRRKNGSVVYILWSAYWSPSEKSMFCVAHDITERKHAENLLRESESRVRSIIESMPVGLVVINHRGVIELINPQTEKMFGYRFDDLLGKHVSVLLPRAQEFDVNNFSEDMYETMIAHVRELEGMRRTGEIFPVEVTLENFNTADGPRFLANMLDVSERHEVERLKREFVSTVSHELRTPLTAIRGSLTLLAVGAMGAISDQAQKVVKIAERNSLRLINLINDLLDIEKLEAGKLEMVFDETAFGPVVERSVESVRAFGEQYGITVEADHSDAVVFADGDRLVQVLVNLLSNAIKYSPRNNVVVVSIEKTDEWVRLGVTDHGRGIPADFRDKIFERFQQVEAADAKQKGGTGLGLAICKAIVEQHNGVIGVDSEEGKGSTFWFCIPLARSPEALKLAARQAPAAPADNQARQAGSGGGGAPENGGSDLLETATDGNGGQILKVGQTNKVAEERA